MVNNMADLQKFISENELVEHELIQGTPEWEAFRLEHDGASEATVALGLSKKTMRNEMLHAKHTGIAKEFSKFVEEKIFPNGHKVEALARPIIMQKYGIRLFPITCSRGRLSASCDGVTMDGETGWEHKQWNADLAAAVAASELPEDYMAQPQQCMLVTGAKRWIFTV